MRKLGIAAVILSLFYLNVFADQTSDVYFHRGIQKYLKKNLDGAIVDVEKAISLGSTEKKVSAFLVKMLLERGVVLFKNKQYQDALEYFEKAKKYDPENKEIESVIENVSEKLKPVASPVSAVTYERVVVQDTVTLDLLKSVQNQQDKLIGAITKPNELIRQILAKSDTERKELINMLDKKNDSMVETIKSIVFYGAVGLIVVIIIVVGLIYFVSVRSSLRREAIMMKQQEAILNVMMQQQVALSQGSSLLRLSDGMQSSGGFVTPRLMLNDPNPRVKAKAIEIVDAQMISEKENPDVAEKILKEFLEDKNNRVRANAAKALFRYKPEMALETIKEMFKSNDKWMQISAAWVLGELEGSNEAAEILLDNIGALEESHYKQRVIKSLTKLNQSENSLPDETQKKIKKAIEKISKDITIQTV
ncbi:MAG: hypothetical protein A2452_05155 [Candidatus Firestonebacteria bacterium RIFOXYC2_FULL_39_67]|nr:MAG: hypothetical protein A2536_10720 [Candidatus Firestonebacteria bacterium RIFOXYD2_FULL_39_29]OGF53031.1 MAG: hypothetical protein A2497_02535 [Candidatus Firestonebacteria bacterium RifOxyC12_full_39_7]OGF54513.1 MAG: hypothetical protein A2452_05155 [Candidatus Firestonebacteria bacterium RIFOXYC2_FULL_39_67]